MKWPELVNNHVLAALLSIIFVVDLCAMQPRKLHVEMGKPYVKAGINCLQRDVASDVWEQGLQQPQTQADQNVRDRIKRHVSSIEFQATIGRMQEALGFTDKTLAKKLSRKRKEAPFDKKDLPIILPRYSQLVWDKLQIYLQHDVNILVQIAAIVQGENPQGVSDDTNALAERVKALNERIKKITGNFKTLALGATSSTAVLERLLWLFDELLSLNMRQIPIESQFLYYRQFFDDKKLLPKDSVAAQKINTQLQNKVIDLMVLKFEDWQVLLKSWGTDLVIENIKALLKKRLDGLKETGAK